MTATFTSASSRHGELWGHRWSLRERDLQRHVQHQRRGGQRFAHRLERLPEHCAATTATTRSRAATAPTLLFGHHGGAGDGAEPQHHVQRQRQPGRRCRQRSAAGRLRQRRADRRHRHRHHGRRHRRTTCIYVDVAGDRVVELASGGTDRVISTVASTRSPANVENLTLGGTGAINGAGNTLGQRHRRQCRRQRADRRRRQRRDHRRRAARTSSSSTARIGSDTILDFADRRRRPARRAERDQGRRRRRGGGWGLTRAAPGGFSSSAELVIFTANAASLTTATAAATIGSATSAYADRPHRAVRDRQRREQRCLPVHLVGHRCGGVGGRTHACWPRSTARRRPPWATTSSRPESARTRPARRAGGGASVHQPIRPEVAQDRRRDLLDRLVRRRQPARCPRGASSPRPRCTS